ncbi:MAG: helix-turn-helix transcriptional regulator [Bacteroidales bacterium]|jgi:transcriptional regulator with XRE-family HTH domain|nr:helix-turn-helix transcriptional regulator [Bacteroidales bacterium]
MDYSRIKTEIERKRISIRDLCYKIDVTEQGLHQMIRNKSMKIEVLERISQVLDVPVSYWFGSDSSSGELKYLESMNDNDDGQVKPTIIYQKIDSLTKDLNDMLKDILVRDVK